MRLAVVLSTQPASLGALAYKGRLGEKLTKIKELGYDCVELAVRDQAIERLKSQIRLGDSLKATVIVGLIRGNKVDRVTDECADAWLVEALRECAKVNRSVKLAIEPINRYETNLLNSVDAVMRFIARLAEDNVGILLDTFHMNIEEPSILKSIQSAKDCLLHLHVADSNRFYPGAGHLDFEEIIRILDRIGYRGYLSAEILPAPDPDTAAERTIHHLRPLVAQRQR